MELTSKTILVDNQYSLNNQKIISLPDNMKTIYINILTK